ncbi:MAG: HepT-like ribonuclease domain-containing protein [bacterium]
MPKKRHDILPVIDVLLALAKIKRHTNLIKSALDLAEDESTYDVMVTQLGLIGESIKKILNFKEFQEIANRKWRVIGDFRNVLAHNYSGIDLEEFFHIIKIEVPLFEKEFFDFVRKIKNHPDFPKAINDAKIELEKSGQRKSLQSIPFIEKLLKP